MGDQALQFVEVGLRQLADGLPIMALRAEGPAQQQLATIHLAVDAQFIGQRCIRVMSGTDGLIQGLEQRVAAKALIELAQVVEGDRCLRQCRHLLPARIIGQVAQHAIAQPLVRHGTQLLFDGLDRSALPGRLFDALGRQAQRVGAGEPADGAGQVNLVEQALTAVAFELNQRRVIAAPPAQHAGQGGEQQVVDLGPVSTGCLLQQLPSLLGVQPHADGLCVTLLPATFRMIAG
ncbi:hypothetical protein D3C78_906390 [compost metagenome]